MGFSPVRFCRDVAGNGDLLIEREAAARQSRTLRLPSPERPSPSVFAMYALRVLSDVSSLVISASAVSALLPAAVGLLARRRIRPASPGDPPRPCPSATFFALATLAAGTLGRFFPASSRNSEAFWGVERSISFALRRSFEPQCGVRRRRRPELFLPPLEQRLDPPSSTPNTALALSAIHWPPSAERRLRGL